MTGPEPDDDTPGPYGIGDAWATFWRWLPAIPVFWAFCILINKSG